MSFRKVNKIIDEHSHVSHVDVIGPYGSHYVIKCLNKGRSASDMAATLTKILGTKKERDSICGTFCTQYVLKTLIHLHTLKTQFNLNSTNRNQPLGKGKLYTILGLLRP